MKRLIILSALLLAGCGDEGSGEMPLPRNVCTQITGTYSCGRGGTCEQCGNWQIGCPKPLKLTQVPGDGKGEPHLACRLKENDNGVHEDATHGADQPLPRTP
jgi:nitrous oxide reductase accessory protein NosL